MITPDASGNPTAYEMFDAESEEPKLCSLAGFEDCETCFFRTRTIIRLKNAVKQLHGGSV